MPPPNGPVASCVSVWSLLSRISAPTSIQPSVRWPAISFCTRILPRGLRLFPICGAAGAPSLDMLVSCRGGTAGSAQRKGGERWHHAFILTRHLTV
jgi:hypothetical protein